MHPLSPRPESLCVELVEPSSPTLGKGSGLLSPTHTLDDVQDATSGRLHAATRRKVETVHFTDGQYPVKDAGTDWGVGHA